MNTPRTHRDHSRIAMRVGSILASLLILSGCQSYDQQTQGFKQATRSGSLASAVVQIDQQAEASVGKKDEILFRLEQGAALRSAGMADPSMVPAIPMVEAEAPVEAADGVVETAPVMVQPTADEVHAHYFTRSLEALDQAEEKVNEWEQKSKVKLGSEIGSAMTNQANLPYRGRSYDKVMMNSYKALNYLALGEVDKARVELNRSLQRQRDAVEANAKRIVKAQEEEEMARNGELEDEDGKSAAYDTQEAYADPQTGPALQAALDESIARMQPYGDYVNPFAVFLDGLYYSVLGVDGSDWERGRKSFERVAGMVPENLYLVSDLEAATAAAEGQSIEGMTYVIFETGTAPSRGQTRIDIPTFLVTSRLAYVGASFPKLEYNDDYVSRLFITLDDEHRIGTFVVSSMDSVVANDFKNAWPLVVTKTLITTATKAIIQGAIQKEVSKRSGWAGSLIGAVVASAASGATNIADTRTWTSLPKEFQYARIKTPEDRELVLEVGNEEKTVTLEPGSVNVVYVKSASSTAPVFVSQFVLK